MKLEADERGDLDVLVVGAGPTGLALAAFLHRYGASVRVVDKAGDRVQESRALAIQPRTLEVLAPLGLSDELVRRGNPTVRLQIHAAGRQTSVPLFDLGLEDTAFPFLLFLSQAETEAVLEDHLRTAGITVERRTQLVALQPDGTSVVCDLRSSDDRAHTVRAKYVVGCDGAHSTVRRLAGIDFVGTAYPQTFLLADVDAHGLTDGAAHAYLSAGGPLFFFPLGTPAPWRVVAMLPREYGRTNGPITLEEVQEVVDRYTGGAVRVRDPVWMTTFRLHKRAAFRYQHGRVLLAGDAAHIHTPAGAQGMNTGIQDAANLAWKLALVVSGAAPDRLVATYDLERRPVGRRVLAFTDRAFAVATSDAPPLRFARRAVVPRVLPILARFTAGRAAAFRFVSQLAIRYRRSPLSVRTVGSRGPKAGDRLPDAPVWVDGARTTLHRALAGPGFHLLLCGPTSAWPSTDALGPSLGLVATHRLTALHAEPGELEDRTGVARRRLGIADGPAYVLVRPDGHVGARGAGDLSAVHAYAETWLTRRIAA